MHISCLPAEDLIDAAFMPISRDGAAMIEVAIRLQKALRAIAHMPAADCAKTARRFSTTATERAVLALDFERDRERLQACVLGED